MKCGSWHRAQVNAALDDAASMAEDMARLLSAARSKGRLTAAERKRTQALMVSVAVRPRLTHSRSLGSSQTSAYAGGGKTQAAQLLQRSAAHLSARKSAGLARRPAR